jgi:putative colanic acid biosynthesis acetyltransferase WcaF
MSNEILQGGGFGSAKRARSFSYANLAYRAVWNVTWLLFAAWTPPQLYAWRRLLLNLFGAKIAKGARVYGSARILNPRNLEMGKGAVLGWNVHCYSMGKIILEDYAEVAQFNHLVTGTHDTESATFQLYTKPIRICSYAWIASGCFIGPGVTVKEGAVLARAAWLSRIWNPGPFMQATPLCR